MKDSIIKDIKLFAIQKFKEYDGKFGSEFMIAATEECIKLIERFSYGQQINKNALIIGAYLHDIGRVVTDGPYHNLKGAEIAEAFFEDNNIDDEEIRNIVLDCVLNHGSNATPKTEEGKIMQFVDKAVLVDVKIVRIYLKKLTEKLSKEEAVKKAKEKVDKWYNSIGPKKPLFDDQYHKCIKFIESY